ncbi:MAG TPA: MFS transporter [Acetobacteraceae bacterium]|nr:MFS transporter [Acetobacteraceae bacterium]
MSATRADRTIARVMPTRSDPVIIPPRSNPDSVRRLMLFFAVVYTVEGIGQAKVGIVWQPLTYFLKTQYGWTALQIAASLSVLDVPWVVKPLYGLLSDFLPLFGYRRRSYLLLSNLGAIVAFVWVTQAVTPAAIVFALVLTSITMAVSSTLCGALLVENGQRHNVSGAFVNQQWMWFSGAAAATSLAGGWLIEIFSPTGALHIAALIAAIAPVAVLICLHLVEEARAGIDREALRRGLDGLLNTFRSRTLLLVAVFLLCYYFSPGLGTPLYFHMTDRLHFSQSFIGALSAISSVGWVAGGLLYRWALTGMRTRALLQLSIVLGTLGTLAFLFMVDPVSAVVVYFLFGVAGMIANVATLTLAAEHCPARAEGFAFAALMSVMNLTAPLADTTGAYLYDHVFDGRLAPLIVVSAAFTAFVLVLIPLFRIERA